MEALSKLGISIPSIIQYVVNFGILFFVIGKYLVPPIINMLDKRREMIEQSVNEANHLKKDFQEKAEQVEREKKEAHQAMLVEMENLKKVLEKKKAEMNQEIQTQKTKMMEDAQKEIDVRKSQLMKEAEVQTVDLIKKIVLHIVQNKLPEEMVKESVKEAWKTYSK